MTKPVDRSSCATCRCWVAAPGAEVGQCKRLPPVPIVVADELTSAFPSTAADDICGEWARRLQS